MSECHINSEEGDVVDMESTFNDTFQNINCTYLNFVCKNRGKNLIIEASFSFPLTTRFKLKIKLYSDWHFHQSGNAYRRVHITTVQTTCQCSRETLCSQEQLQTIT